jgi:hypothetical protein
MIRRFLMGSPLQSMGDLAAWPLDYVCDTWAERPTSGLIPGSRCFALDTGKLWRATNATTWTEIGGGSGGAAWGEITGTLSGQTDLQTALDAKSGTGHNHDSAYAAAGHTHAYDPAGTAASAVSTHAAAADPHTGYQKESEKGAANGYASLDASGLVPAAQLPASGSDPWTYVRLGADFTTSSATAVDAGLAFTPALNTRYEFEATLLLRTATATVNPRAGLAWATGLTDGVGSIDQAQTATTQLMVRGNINAALLVAVGGLPNTTQSWPCTVWGYVVAGASPSGTVRIQLASETAGTVVRIVAGSYLKYRTVP